MSSAYFRFPTSQGGSLQCCPCSPPTVQCIINAEVKGDNWTATKQIQFGGGGISPGGQCGTTTTHCDNLFNTPIVCDGDQGTPCNWAHFLPDDANCLFPPQARFELALVDRGAGLARWDLDYWDGDDGTGAVALLFRWSSNDLAVPVDMSAWTGALNGTYDNSVFGLPPNFACWFQNVTASIVA